jgi:6-pyruvoyl-tetrahydropterin synthase related domain
MKGQGPGIGDQASTPRTTEKSPKVSHRFAGCAVILFAALIATAPQLLRGNSCGHDFDFHLVSWFDALGSWREGILYPRWSASANFGAGEPRFVFYPPVSWMLGAALGLVAPWKGVPMLMTFLFLAGAGLATRALARQALQEGPATLAGCVALFSGYALFTAYERSDFAELTGGFWIPLLLLFVFRDRNASGGVWRRAFDRSTVPLALVVAGAWLSNPPVGVMTSYLLAAVALVVAVLWRSWAPILRASVAVVLGLGLSGIYLVPAALEQRWIDLSQILDDPGYKLENNWMFARHANPVLELHDVELFKASGIAATMIAVTLAGIAICWLRRRLPGYRSWWIPLALIPIVVLFLQFPVSDLVWSVLPKLRFLQFPWRWLVVVQAPMGIFFASAVWVERPRSRMLVLTACAGAFLAATLVAGFIFYQPCDEEDAVKAMVGVYHAGTGFEGTDEYTPSYADNSSLAMNLPMACLSSSPQTALGQGAAGAVLEWSADQGTCDATFPETAAHGLSSAEHLRVAGDVPHGGFLILRVRSYPAWQIKINGKVTGDLPERPDGLIAVPVTKGHLEVTVDWTITSDVIEGRWLSALALALGVALFSLERRFSRGRLS